MEINLKERDSDGEEPLKMDADIDLDKKDSLNFNSKKNRK